jgi:hypothetical protein
LRLETVLPAAAVIWGSLALAVYCAGLLCITAAATGQDGIGIAGWKIGQWSLAWCAVTSGLATVTWSQPQTGSASQIAITSVLRALWLVAVAMTAWALGYSAGPWRQAVHQAARLTNALAGRYNNEVRSAAVPWILLGTGIAARLVSTAVTGRFGYTGDPESAVTSASGYGQILGILSLGIPLAVAVAALRAFSPVTRGSRLTVAVMLVGDIAIGAVAGGKQSFIVAVLAVAIPYAGARRRIPKGLMAAAVIIFLVVVIPFNHGYRNIARHGSTSIPAGQAIAAAPVVLQQVIRQDGSLSMLPKSLDYLAERIREIDAPAIIMQRTPSQVRFVSPLQYAIAPIADLIPRVVWPGKPISAAGYHFSQQYYGLPTDAYTSSAITPAGDLYRHGGWIPVIAGMFLLGCVIRVLDNVLDIRASAHAALLVFLLFPDLVKAEDDWATLMIGIPVVIVTWLAVVAVTFSRCDRAISRPA